MTWHSQIYLLWWRDTPTHPSIFPASISLRASFTAEIKVSTCRSRCSQKSHNIEQPIKLTDSDRFCLLSPRCSHVFPRPPCRHRCVWWPSPLLPADVPSGDRRDAAWKAPESRLFVAKVREKTRLVTPGWYTNQKQTKHLILQKLFFVSETKTKIHTVRANPHLAEQLRGLSKASFAQGFFEARLIVFQRHAQRLAALHQTFHPFSDAGILTLQLLPWTLTRKRSLQTDDALVWFGHHLKCSEKQ